MATEPTNPTTWDCPTCHENLRDEARIIEAVMAHRYLDWDGEVPALTHAEVAWDTALSVILECGCCGTEIRGEVLAWVVYHLEDFDLGDEQGSDVQAARTFVRFARDSR